MKKQLITEKFVNQQTIKIVNFNKNSLKLKTHSFVLIKVFDYLPHFQISCIIRCTFCISIVNKTKFYIYASLFILLE